VQRIETVTAERQRAHEEGRRNDAERLDRDLNGPGEPDRIVDDLLIPAPAKGLYADKRLATPPQASDLDGPAFQRTRHAPPPPPEAGRLAR
jgi:hypothetical protein